MDPFPMLKPFKQRNLPVLAKRYQQKDKKKSEIQSINTKLAKSPTTIETLDTLHSFKKETSSPIIEISLEKLEQMEEKAEANKEVANIPPEIPDADNTEKSRDLDLESEITDSVKVAKSPINGNDSSIKSAIRTISCKQKLLDIPLLQEICRLVSPMLFANSHERRFGRISKLAIRVLDLADYDLKPLTIMQEVRTNYQISSRDTSRAASIKSSSPRNSETNDDLKSWDYGPRNHGKSMKKLHSIERLGGLGPDKGSEDYQKRLEKMAKQREYAEKVRAMSKDMVPDDKKSIKFPIISPPRENSKVQRMKLYASTIRKPQQSKKELPVIADKYACDISKNFPMNNEDLYELEKKHEQHIQAIQSIRKELGYQ